MSRVPDRHPLRASVVLDGRGDSASLPRALRAVLSNPGSFDVWLLVEGPDAGPRQSANARTDVEDPRVHRLPVGTRSSAAAHNAAIAAAGGGILVITDVDCEVAPTWIEELVRAFDRDPRIGLVFGRVEPARPEDGSAPSHLVEKEFLARDPGDKPRVEGIWACMAVRRRTWEALGGFDDRFGKGARFPGCADQDLALRALAAGHFVLETPRPVVRTHRRLPPADHRRAVEAYTYAAGALLGSHLRRRTPGALRLALDLARRRRTGPGHPALGAAAHAPSRRMATFLRGVGAGFGAGPRDRPTH